MFTRLLPAVPVSDAMMQKLMQFKATESKSDPTRRQGLHGPYEELTLLKTGCLPLDYYTAGDAEPWGLRIEESRSNLLWQVTAGLLDRQPEFGGAYMSLSLDRALSDDDYARELQKLNHDWKSYMEHAGILRDHQHSSMRHMYQSVACPACSVLTATAIRDEGMHSLFKQMLSLSPNDRMKHLEKMGLTTLLTTMIPEQAPSAAR